MFGCLPAPQSDYRLLRNTYIARVGAPAVISISLNFDNIAQESDETFGLELQPIGASPPGFFVNTITVAIQDRTGRFSYWIFCILFICILNNIVVTFELNENDYSGAEDDGFIVATINKNVRLANRVTLLLTPYSISVAIESRQPLPDDIPTEDNLLQNYARCK